jgi:hypothetical protein
MRACVILRLSRKPALAAELARARRPGYVYGELLAAHVGGNSTRWWFPETRAQRCWFHKTANMLLLSALPKSAHPGAKKALAEIWNAEAA